MTNAAILLESTKIDREIREPDYAAERRLPEGTTCGDCRHGPRCDGLFGAVRKQFSSCDFWPPRFIRVEGGPA